MNFLLDIVWDTAGWCLEKFLDWTHARWQRRVVTPHLAALPRELSSRDQLLLDLAVDYDGDTQSSQYL